MSDYRMRDIAETIVSKWEAGSNGTYVLVDDDGRPDWMHRADAESRHMEAIATADNPMDIIGADWSEVEASHDDLVDAIAEAFEAAWTEYQAGHSYEVYEDNGGHIVLVILNPDGVPVDAYDQWETVPGMLSETLAEDMTDRRDWSDRMSDPAAVYGEMVASSSKLVASGRMGAAPRLYPKAMGVAATIEFLGSGELYAVMTSEEIAETYGIDTSTIRRACLAGWIHARKSGRSWLIRREDAEKRWGKGGTVTLYRPDAQ